MKHSILTYIILSSSWLSHAETPINSDTTETLDEIQVEGETLEHLTTKLLPESSSIMKDTSEVLRKMPGANVNQNGPLSGIAQYRGLFGSRVNVQSGDVQVVESCSNSMDAAMSHVPASMVDAVVLQRGISSVTAGVETIGGVINVVPKKFDTGSDGFSGQLSLGHATGNDGTIAATNLQYGRNAHAVALGLDFEDGNNYAIPTGKNNFTGLNRKYYTFSYLYDEGSNTLGFNSNYNDTGETGTPALPMDIIYAKGGINDINFNRILNEKWQLNTTASVQSTDHLMNNFSFRDQTLAAQRASYTEVNRQAFSLEIARKHNGTDLIIGIDYDDQDNQADIFNPNNANFRITNFDTNKTRISLYSEYSRKLNDKNRIIFGLRHTNNEADANQVSSSVAMMDNQMGQLHRTLQDRFNSAERNKTDNNTDFTFTWLQSIHADMQLEYGFGIKNRAPTHQERYLWLPLEATAGLADGRQYLGNLDLDSERAYQFELGLNYQTESITVAPHIFYHRINDYIQGTPNTIMPAPPGVLRFSNVDAELYGFDIEWTWQIGENLSFRNVINYVRGKRTDIDDNLYRIAPINTWANLSYQRNRWQWDIDILAALEQDKVAVTNSERSTPGFGIMHTSFTYSVDTASQIKLSINNLFDKLYYHHTNGFNRNNTNIDVGFDPNNLQAFRLPGEGRNVQLSYQINW
ncbi:TonB-dependent receptor [Marinicella sp. S1101]|uniref:TonB-dependent receptor n=1 Tax=Marinicella marina TaxID=2996016 RepID=UPI002260EEC1|nr:TonB-dependent receptor [Marinicella marina]MCX7554184.1 TonB-dependent receptor [Marinicella marina]MDJ1141123.1 TonB-dependent receptor [Marinicella marina]